MAEVWRTAVMGNDAVKLCELVLSSAASPEVALEVVRNCAALLEKETSSTTGHDREWSNSWGCVATFQLAASCRMDGYLVPCHRFREPLEQMECSCVDSITIWAAEGTGFPQISRTYRHEQQLCSFF